jgi:hypothetical protein
VRTSADLADVLLSSETSGRVLLFHAKLSAEFQAGRIARNRGQWL